VWLRRANHITTLLVGIFNTGHKEYIPYKNLKTSLSSTINLNMETLIDIEKTSIITIDT